jgi:serine/threonine-protein kinase RsbW
MSRRPLVVQMRTAIFPAQFDQLEPIRQFTGQAAKDFGMTEAEVYAIQFAVDEACTNVIEHAYRGIEGGDIECTCDSDGDKMTILLRDHGRPFDPSTVPVPDLKANLKKRRVGGLGVYLMRWYMDEVHYEQLGESGNLVTLVKRRKLAE